MTNQHRKALVVAIDRYEHPTLRQLAAPAADAAALAEVLGDPQLGGFDVSVLANVDSSQIAEAMEALLAECVPSDLVLLHFSCHGIKDDSGELFLAATNTVPNRLFATAVDSSLVNRLVQRSRAQRVILLLDCCYGGAFERGVVARASGSVDVAGHFAETALGGGRGRVVITASSAMEYAFEGTALADNSGPSPSLFTGALVQGIRSGEADRDQDGHVSLDELYDYVHDKVRERTPNQTPSKWEFGVQGDLYVSRNPHRRVVPAPLPDDVQELVVHSNASVRLTAVEELNRLVSGSELRLAAAARLALQDLQDNDSRRVSEAAAKALMRTAIRVVPDAINFGRVASGSTAKAELRIEGGPLAAASAVQTSTDSLRAQIEGSVLWIFATATGSDSLDGLVTISGPAGDAQVEVSGTVDAPATGPAEAPATGAGEATGTGTVEVLVDAAKAPRFVTVILLVLLGAAAAFGSLFGEQGIDDADTIRRFGRAWLVLSPAACVLAAAGLLASRSRVLATATIAAGSVWTWLFWMKGIAGPLEKKVPLGHIVADSFRTGLWARLFAAVALTIATGLLLHASPVLRAPVALRRDLFAVLGGALVFAGAALQPLNNPHAWLWVQLVVLLLVFTPMAILGFSQVQRRAVLVAATVLAIVLIVPDLWTLHFEPPSPRRLSDDNISPDAWLVRPKGVPSLLGLLLLMTGSYVGQRLWLSVPTGSSKVSNDHIDLH